MLRTGGKVLVDQLALHGSELAFCVPGESYLAVLDALHDAPIRLVTCRHEAAAANMAKEIDYRRMFNSMAKWLAQIESAKRIPELLARAFTVATAGRPGPVVLGLPEDMLVDESTWPIPGRTGRCTRIPAGTSSNAAAFGVHAERVEATDEFAPALERALAEDGPALLHLVVDPEAITPHTTLTAVREGTAARERTETV